MSRYLGSMFKRSRRFGISLLENNKEFSKGKPLHLVNMVLKELNLLIINFTCMKNKKSDICMV